MELKAIRLKESVRITEMETSFLTQQYFVSMEGKQWKVKESVYWVIKSIMDEDTTEQFQIKYKQRFGNDIDMETVDYVISSFLIKRGFLIGTNDTVKKNELNIRSKYLWGRFPLIKEKYVEKVRFLQFMYYKPVSIFLATFILFSLSYCGYDLIKSGYTITKLLCISINDSIEVLLIFFFAAMFHELGHMSYLLKNNIKVGCIGFAFYYLSPVFYSDVSMAWELPRKKRQILDLGGIYFQSVLLAIVGCIGIVLNRKGLILACLIGMINILSNLNPFLKMDGYWFVSDYLGIPNLHKRTWLFWEEQVMGIFRIHSTKEKVLDEIKKREKRQFIVYSLLVVVYMLSFYIGLLTIGSDVIIQLGRDISSIVEAEEKIEIIANYLSKNFMLVFTAIMLVRIFAIAFIKVCSRGYKLYKKIKKAKAA